jgi:hypothetical protein
MEEDRQFLSPGQIRDLRDDAGMEGRQLKAMREEAEAALKSVPSAFLGPERVLLEELGADETSLTENSREHEARRLETLAQGLVIVIRDVVETTTTTTLAKLAAAPLGDVDVAVDGAFKRIGCVVQCWLKGRAGWKTWREETGATVPLRLSVAASRDAALAEHIDVFRTASHLRRLQFALAGAVKRLDCAVAVLEVESALRRRIRL